MMKLDPSWKRRFQHLKIYDGGWKIMKELGCGFQALPINGQLITNNFCQVSSCRKCHPGYQSYVNRWTLGGAMLITMVFEKQADWSITSLICKWRLRCSSYIPMTHFQAWFRFWLQQLIVGLIYPSYCSAVEQLETSGWENIKHLSPSLPRTRVYISRVRYCISSNW